MEKEINVLDLIRKNQFSFALKQRNLTYLFNLMFGDLEAYNYEVVSNYVLSSDSFKNGKNYMVAIFLFMELI